MDVDELWLRAPALALRLWPALPGEAAPRWRLNPAAARWSAEQELAELDWLRFAQAVRPAVASGATDGRAALSSPGIEMLWSAVALEGGWLLWLTPSVDEAQRLRARLDVVQRLGRMGSWERDLRTGEGRWDTNMFELLGLDPAGGTPHFDAALQLVHPDDRAQLLQDNARFARADGRYETRYRIVTPAGEVKDIYALFEVVSGADGQPERMTGVLIDETEAATRLRTSEAMASLWMRAVDLGAVALWRLDLADGQVYFSDWGYRMLGLDPQHDQLNIEQLRDLIHPDDVAAVVAAADEAVRSRQVVDVEARYRHRSGGYRHLYTRRVAEFDPAGQAIAISGVTIDMTERIAERERAKAFAERIDRVTNAAGVGIWTVDVETRAVEWNDQMYRL
jgi:PAS domain-containing protein